MEKNVMEFRTKTSVATTGRAYCFAVFSRLSLVCAVLSVLARPFLVGQTVAPATAPTAPVVAYPYRDAPIKPVEFDVAVFKINKSGGPMPYIQIPVAGDGFLSQNRPLHDLIRYAFAKGRGGSFKMTGEPSWVDDDRYDVQAKVAVEDLPEWKKLNGQGQKIVLQKFLIEYLKLKVHPDPTPYPYYALVVGKNGSKVRQSKPGNTFKTPDGKTTSGRALLATGPNELTAQAIPIEQFTDFLSGHADRLVLDKTGLDDFYDFVLQFDPTTSTPEAPALSFFSLPPEAATPTMFSAVKQLGLQLMLTKGPIDAIVIDHVERPPQN
jgi:uncharacterized protein (TIGR03435 family)